MDHGKTSLLRALTGIDPDRLKEEKERQMTTDLGFAHLRVDDHTIIGFVDVPGHGKFLKNMLAGVGGIDLALLVVAADEGPMPQTVQHVRILSLLGIKNAIVALTKIDTVSDSDHLQIVHEEIGSLLRNHGMNMLELVPVSSTKSTGISELKQALLAAVLSMPERDTAGGAFLPVDRVFNKAGFGTVITGTLVRGKLSTGDQIIVGPELVPGRVRRLETFGHTVEVAKPGQRVACNVVLKETQPITRGHVVLGAEIPATRSLLVSLIDKPRVFGDKFIERTHGQPIRLYHGTAECHGYVRWAEASSSSDENESIAIAFIALEDPVIAQAQDRFVIRLSDETIFGGEVLMRDRPKWFKRLDLLGLANQLIARDYEGALSSFVSGAPQHMARLSQLSLFLPGPLQESMVNSLLHGNSFVMLGDALLSTATRESLSRKLAECITRGTSLQETRLSDGVSMELVRTFFSPKIDRGTFQSLLDEEAIAGRVIRRGDKLSLPGVVVGTAADAATEKLHAAIKIALDEHFSLDLAELARACGADVGKIKSQVQALAKGGTIHLINYEFVISDANLKKAHHTLSDIWNKKKNIAPSDFRESLGTTRKYAMALLQHFDDNKVTRRLNDGRVLLKAPQIPHS